MVGSLPTELGRLDKLSTYYVNNSTIAMATDNHDRGRMVSALSHTCAFCFLFLTLSITPELLDIHANRFTGYLPTQISRCQDLGK